MPRLKPLVILLWMMLFSTASNDVHANLPDSISRSISNDDPAKEIDSLIHLARHYSRTASIEFSTEIAKEALLRAQKLKNDSLMLKAYFILGSSYEDLGYYRMAVQTYESSFPILARSGTLGDRGNMYNALGIALDYLGNYQKSLHYYFRADSCYLALRDTVGHAHVLNNIGLIHFNQKNRQDAKSHFMSSLKVAESLNDPDLLAMSYSNLGMVAMEANNYDEALHYYTACLEIDLAGDPPNPNWVGSDYSSLGEIWTSKGQYDSAFHYYGLGINFKRKAQAKRPLITAYHQMAQMHLEANDASNAMKYMDSASALSADVEDPLVHLEQHRIRANIFTELGQPEKATLLLKRYIELNDSLTQAQNYKDGKLLEEEFNLQLHQREVEEIEAKLEAEEALNRNFKIGLFVVVLLSIGLLYLFYLNLRKNKKLEAQQADLQDALSVKTRFLSVVSHEIRTPLHVIQGMANSLHDSGPSSESNEAVKALQASSEQLTHLVNEILDLNKLEHGSMKIKQLPFQLKNVIETLSGAYSQQCEAKEIDFKLHLDENLPNRLIGDRLKLEQVLNNLLNNAVKFTDQGAVSLRIEETQKGEKESTIKFTVSDTGVGISKEHHAEIFKPFFQSDAGLNRSYSGTGLGLAISSSILELMGAKLDLKSSLNQGTSLSFSIPLEHDNTELEKPISLVEDGWKWPNSKKILVAEDYEQNRMLLRMMLNKFNAEATWTENGLECLQAAQGGNYQCILLDIHMPIMDGYEAAQKLRELFGDAVCIIGLTAANQEETKNQGTENFDFILYKPYSQKQLQEVLEMSILRHTE